MNADQENIQPAFQKDFLWYLLGSIVPLLIGFIKTPVFTRHFGKDSFGQLGLVTITFAFLGMLLFSWISSCLWRYYSRYEASGRLTILYSNLFFLFLLSLGLLTLISAIWLWDSDNYLIQQLIVYSFLQMIFNQLFLGYMVVVRLIGKSGYYNIFQGIRALFGLLIALILVFYLNAEITALVSSLALADALSLLFLTFLNPAKLKLGLKEINISVLKELLHYGSMGLILNISLLSISYSDRYIIAMFYNLEEVGIYDQVSKISQLSVMALITIYFNTINPSLLRRLDADFKGALIHIQAYILAFVFFGFPIVFYLSLFSEEIADVLLGEAFREGYLLMPYIFLATYLYGLSNFFELRLKFSNKLLKLSFVALITALFNIILNLIFVSNFGYHWAAYTTLCSYMIMILILFYGDPEVCMMLRQKWRLLLKIIGLLTIQYLIYVLYVDKLKLQLEARIGIGLIFAFVYFLYFRKDILKIKTPIT